MENSTETNKTMANNQKYFIQKLPITSKENNGVYETWTEWSDA